MELFGKIILTKGILYEKSTKECVVKKALFPSSNCTIEKSLNNVPVTCVWQKAFKNANVKSIVLPDTIKFIGPNSFSGTALKEVKIPALVETIWNEAFYNCKNLKKVELPNDCKVIYECAFSSCSNLTEINLKNVSVIHSSAFADCISLASAFLWSASWISSYSFAGCTNLKAIVIGDSCTEINGSAFKNCINLKTVVMSKNISDIGGSGLRLGGAEKRLKRENPFLGCSSLKRILYNGSPSEINAEVRDFILNKCGIEIYYYSKEPQKGTWCYSETGYIIR